jgi:acyl-coenzyme A synthetase/AMP-(fatty) acid ligase
MIGPVLRVIGELIIVPAELERLIGTHPAVAEVVVVSEGETLRAFVVPTAGPHGPLEQDLLSLVGTWPAVVNVTLRESLPRTTNGKIRRRLLSGPGT